MYNVYRQLNPNMVFLHYDSAREDGETEPKQHLVMEKVTILPLVPSVSYTYQF